ncbi:hypothetical protein B5X24_HaOG207667 [Helicoverpa armigera]|uniref:Uncharacterized protein n=1 Tax=Helicoverpa armigera TaxID=29058 RepID=A0A2W1BNX7_HELAM|nr:hypothetical protein B5X24_HaOG207667 [Helicoverpa armigera]
MMVDIKTPCTRTPSERDGDCRLIITAIIKLDDVRVFDGAMVLISELGYNVGMYFDLEVPRSVKEQLFKFHALEEEVIDIRAEISHGMEVGNNENSDWEMR